MVIVSHSYGGLGGGRDAVEIPLPVRFAAVFLCGVCCRITSVGKVWADVSIDRRLLI